MESQNALRDDMLLVSESATCNVLVGEHERCAPISGAMILHSEITEAPLTDRELGLLAIVFGPPPTLPPARRCFFVSDCVRGNTISLI